MSLRKEMAIAIFLGLLFGGGVAFGLRQLPDRIQEEVATETETTQAPEETPSPTPLLEESISLEILLPEQQSLINEDTVTVSGKTAPGALVAITSEVDETVVTAEKDGTFSGPIELVEGANELYVVSILQDSELSKTIVVNHTTESL